MTFAHYEFTAGASIREHFHPEEGVYEVIEGDLELTIDGRSQIAKPGVVGIVPANSRHSVKALTKGRLIVVDHPSSISEVDAKLDDRKAEDGGAIDHRLRQLSRSGALWVGTQWP